MRASSELTPSGAIGVGLLMLAIGSAIILAALGVIPGGRMNAPPWIVGLAGFVFAMAGTALMSSAFGGRRAGEAPTPLWLRAVQYLLGVAMFASFALIGSWVAFGPGPRSFTTNVPFLGSGPANEIGGRIAFGIGAVLTWLCALIAAVAGVRRLTRRDG